MPRRSGHCRFDTTHIATGHEEGAAMTSADFAMILTGERMMTKYAGGRERPSRDAIARLAYHFYETRGRREGQDVDAWLSAEQEFTRHYP
jgi:hypothetical protein